MPTAYAEAIHQAVKTLAKDRRFEVADGCVTAGQRQAAALVALTLGDPGSVGTVTGPVAEAKLAVHVNVLVPLATLVGASEQGGRVGNVPVTADVIRDLISQAAVGSSTIRRLVTDPMGVILDAGRRHYLASDLQRLVLKLRDGYCRFPGCSNPAEHAEIDHAEINHATPVDRGSRRAMRASASGPRVPGQQQSKRSETPTTKQPRDGSCTRRSPLGRIYEHTPPDLIPPPPDEPRADPPPF